MHNYTIEDYKKAVQEKFDIEKELDNVPNPSQANLRNLCWEIFEKNKDANDLFIFKSFFGFEFDYTKKNQFRESTDRFRPIGTFYKRLTDLTDKNAVNLAAILVDFQPRPFNKFRKVVGNENVENVEGIELINLPVLELTIVDAKEVENLEKIEFFTKKESKNPLEKRDGNSIKFYDRLFRKSKTTMIIIATVFCLILAVIYFACIKKNCMQWSEDHYEVVDCNSGIAKDLNTIIPLNDELLNLRKLQVCDTTKCFKPDGQAIIWYAKISNDSVEFFTTHGRHPENGKPLRPVTHYILDKYVNKKKQE